MIADIQTNKKRPVTGRLGRLSSTFPKRQPRANNALKRLPAPKLAGGQNILVPVDFSRHSLEALRKAASLARRCGASLLLLHVMDPIYATGRFESATMRQLKEDARKHSERDLAALARKELDPDFPAKSAIQAGIPYAEITKMASKERVSLIVIASRGNTGLKRLLLGSTAEKVVRFAPCPVLVLR